MVTASNGDTWPSRRDGPVSDDPTLAIDGIQVRSGREPHLDRMPRRIVGSTWTFHGMAATWSLVVRTDSLTTGADDDRSVGSDLSLSMWGSHAWTRDDLSNANFRIRLTWRDGTPSCSANQALAS